MLRCHDSVEKSVQDVTRKRSQCQAKWGGFLSIDPALIAGERDV